MCVPISIFLAVFCLSYKVADLMKLLSPPIKRYILVQDLLVKMLNPLVVRHHLVVVQLNFFENNFNGFRYLHEELLDFLKYFDPTIVICS